MVVLWTMVIIILREEQWGIHSSSKSSIITMYLGHVLAMAPRVAYIYLGCLHANCTCAKGRDFFLSQMVELRKIPASKNHYSCVVLNIVVFIPWDAQVLTASYSNHWHCYLSCKLSCWYVTINQKSLTLEYHNLLQGHGTLLAKVTDYIST